MLIQESLKRGALYLFRPVSDIDVVFSDSGIKSLDKGRFEKSGVEVIVV